MIRGAEPARRGGSSRDADVGSLLEPLLLLPPAPCTAHCMGLPDGLASLHINQDNNSRGSSAQGCDELDTWLESTSGGCSNLSFSPITFSVASCLFALQQPTPPHPCQTMATWVLPCVLPYGCVLPAVCWGAWERAWSIVGAECLIPEQRNEGTSQLVLISSRGPPSHANSSWGSFQAPWAAFGYELQSGTDMGGHKD